MRNAKAVAPFAALGLAVAACSGEGASENRVVAAEASPQERALQAEREQARSALEAAAELWQSHGLDTYVYVLQNSCFCAPEFVHPVRVVVEQGVAVSAQDMVDLSDQPQSAISIGQRLAEARIRAQQDTGGRTVTYDPVLGYPLDVFAYDPSCADCSSGWSIDCFAQGAGPEDCPMPTFSAAECARQQRTPVQTSELLNGLCDGKAEPLIALSPPGAVCCP